MTPNIRHNARGPYRAAPQGWLKRFAGRLKQHIDATERGANAVGIARTSLFDWIIYKRQPKAHDLFLIGKATGVSIDWLLFGEAVPVMRGERTAIGELQCALRSHAEATLTSAVPASALHAFVRSGGEYLAEVERSATKQYEVCLLALARSAISYLQWLQGQIRAYELESATASSAASGAKSVIGTLSSSSRELTFRLTEERHDFSSEAPQLLSTEAVASIIYGGIETVAWLARYDDDRPRGRDEPDPPAKVYRSAIDALTQSKPAAEVAVIAPGNFLNMTDVKKACGILQISPSRRATFRWINDPRQQRTK